MANSDFLTQYKAISAKLKKRFLRKPNIAEASAQFTSLSKELENEECPHYAAFCCLAVARCEHTVGNAVYEAHNLVHAARLFLEKENESHELLCPSYHEYLQAAIAAYTGAIKVHLDNNQTALAASLYLELGQSLKYLCRIREAIPYMFKAAALHRGCALDYLNDLKEISDCRLRIDSKGVEVDSTLRDLLPPIQARETRLFSPSYPRLQFNKLTLVQEWFKSGMLMSLLYRLQNSKGRLYEELDMILSCLGDNDGALTVLTEMQVIIEKRGFKENGERIGAFTQLLTYVEVTRLLLLLLLQPPDFKINPEHKKLLDRYADMDIEPVDYIDDDLYLMLQSLTMCINENDLDALRELEKDLWPLLSGLQCDILLSIIEHFKDMAIKMPCRI